MEASDHFFERPILNNPYLRPIRHWELDGTGQPTQKVIETRRRAEFITPIPKPRKRKGAATQGSLVLDEGKGLSTAEQRYELTSSKINDLRGYVEEWRKLRNPNDWLVTPETARLLQHWRSYKFNGVRPFFCQIEAAETTIWLSEVAPKFGKAAINHLGDEVMKAFRLTP
jgi:type III restriction enzyme